MSKKKLFINFGGVGGCAISESLTDLKLDFGRYPFDWIHSNQDFIFDVLNDKNHFFKFEEKYISGQYLTKTNYDALILHDFINNDDFINNKNTIIEKYQRRLNRLEFLMSNIKNQNKIDIVFIRYLILNDEDKHNVFHPDKPVIFKGKKDSISKWEDFMNKHKNCKLILIANEIDNITTSCNNIFIHKGENTVPDVTNIIQKYLH